MDYYRFFIYTILLLLAFSGRGLAIQDSDPLGSSASKVSVSTKLSAEKIPAGSTFKAALILNIAEGWHINSHTPSFDYLIGTNVQLEPKEGIILSDLQYPPGKNLKFAFADDVLNVYEGSVKIFLSLKLSERFPVGKDTLLAKLRVQACDDQVCLAPSTIDVPIPFDVIAADEAPVLINDDVFSSYTSEVSIPVGGLTNEIADVFEQRGSFFAFLAIFLVGLALNLTPCVYPMMSVTVSLFGSQTETSALHVFPKALTYVLGMATMYSVLGVSAALSGGLFGSWLQSPWVLGGVGALLIGLALSNFGLYHIQAPYWLTSRLGGTMGTGLLSLYVSGLIVGIFAAPCIGPPVIALLAFVGSKADPVFGFWAFFILSLGLGLPYLILGTFSGMLKKIPRSGVWMVWVERIFGVVLAAAGMFFLSLAFLPAYAAYVVPLALFTGGVYLGFVESAGKETKFRFIKWAFGVVTISFGIIFANALREPGVIWEQYSDARLTQARESEKPVMLDFYADWCIPCLELDHKTFTDPAVIEATREFVRLKVDLTHFDSPEAENLRKRFNIAGVPTIIFLDRTGEEVTSSRVVGYIPPAEFIERTKPAEGGLTASHDRDYLQSEEYSTTSNVFPSNSPEQNRPGDENPVSGDSMNPTRATIEGVIERNRKAGKKPNRLIKEKSPYLLQHAFNPVDWYPWGEQAFEKARREDKPIFLSIGYSTCYWCHVMEREVFEDDSIAALMNKYVVSIKVDREERPDVDRVYMSALQAMTGSGGWPMSMFLTHDLVPFFGGTYIPPTAQHGRAGFSDILTRVREVWATDRQQIHQISQQIEDFLRQSSAPEVKATAAGKLALERGFDSFSKSYDSKNAGFGGAPKFPRPVSFNFLLRYYSRTGERKAREMSIETLRRMVNGGMYDHVGGGFHRYATDERWHVPHFEKMLYDQAQLVISYLEAYQITHDSFFADVARDILAYVQRNMTHPEGGFYSAEDAESAPDATRPEEKEEGAFYTWTKRELDQLLGPEEANIFHYYYGVKDNGNVASNPHQEFVGENIFYVARSLEETAKQFTLKEIDVKQRLRSARQKLFGVREKRPHPHLDDKVLVSWNGLMISAFARAHQVLSDQKYLNAAERASQFILKNMYNLTKKELLRRYRDGEARYEAQLDDYAFFIQGLLDLYEASLDIRWLKTAISLTEEKVKLFYDKHHGGFYDISGKDKSILARSKDSYDGAEPTGNAIAILSLLRLAQMTDNQKYNEMADKSLTYFGERMLNTSQGLAQFLVALDFSLSKPKQIIIAGKSGDVNTQAILKEVHSRFIPNKIILLADGGEGQSVLQKYIPFIESVNMIDGKSTAYICENYACELPTPEARVVAQLLDGKNK